jgi:hypothetical protein
MRSGGLLLLFSLSACTGEERETGDTASPDGDTSETGETGDTGESGLPDLGEDSVTFYAGGEYGGTTVSLTWVDAKTMGHRTLDFGAVVASAPAAEQNEFALHRPPDEEMVEIDPEGHPGVRVALYAPTLHLDTDGDGAPSEAEGYVGVAQAWLLFVDGNPSGVVALPTARRGWNAMEMDLTPGIMVETRDMSEVPIFPSLQVQDNATIAGAFVGEVTPSTGLAVVSQLALEGGTVEVAAIADRHADATFEMRLRGEPPADHETTLFDGVPAALEQAVVYEDSDSSGTFTPGDTLTYGMCVENEPIGMAYLDRVPTLDLARSLVGVGVTAGWVPVALEPEVRVISSDVLTTVVAGSGCMLAD